MVFRVDNIAVLLASLYFMQDNLKKLFASVLYRFVTFDCNMVKRLNRLTIFIYLISKNNKSHLEFNYFYKNCLFLEESVILLNS